MLYSNITRGHTARTPEVRPAAIIRRAKLAQSAFTRFVLAQHHRFHAVLQHTVKHQIVFFQSGVAYGQPAQPFSTLGDDPLCSEDQLSRESRLASKTLPTLPLIGWVFFKCLPSLPRELHDLGHLVPTIALFYLSLQTSAAPLKAHLSRQLLLSLELYTAPDLSKSALLH